MLYTCTIVVSCLLWFVTFGFRQFLRQFRNVGFRVKMLFRVIDDQPDDFEMYIFVIFVMSFPLDIKIQSTNKLKRIFIYFLPSKFKTQWSGKIENVHFWRRSSFLSPVHSIIKCPFYHGSYDHWVTQKATPMTTFLSNNNF